MGEPLTGIEGLGDGRSRAERAHERGGEQDLGRSRHPYLKASSRAVAASVFSSRYFTITGV
jgi:hypothetical protein